MKLAIALSLAALAAGCGKADDKKPETKTDDKKPETRKEDVKKKAEVKYSHADLVAAKALVKPLQPFDEALAKLEAKLGKPQMVAPLIDNIDMYHWARVEDGACASLAVQRGCDQACGDKVGSVWPEAPLRADDPRYEQCVARAEGRAR